jgi:hypothetical protein
MKTNLLHLLLAGSIACLASCTKDTSNETSISDNGISSVATSTGGTDMIRSVNNDNETWNIRMNDVASEAKAGGCTAYPNHAMLIKEKHDANGNIIGYDVMYKDPGNANAAGDGWVYVELSGDGKIIYGSNMKGASCQNCHRAQVRGIL